MSPTAKMSRVAITRIDLDYQAHPLRLYRSSRLAKLFGVDESTIWRWKQSGVLPPPAAKFPGFEAWTEEQLVDRVRQARGEAEDAD